MKPSTNHTHSLPLGGVGGGLPSTNRTHSLPPRGSRWGLRLLKARITYFYAKLKAEQLNKFTGRRQFVLMTDCGKLMVMDKTLFYKLRKRGHMPPQIKPHMLQRISVYYTAGMYKGRLSPCMAEKSALIKKRRYLNYIRNLQ